MVRTLAEFHHPVVSHRPVVSLYQFWSVSTAETALLRAEAEQAVGMRRAVRRRRALFLDEGHIAVGFERGKIVKSDT